MTLTSSVISSQISWRFVCQYHLSAIHPTFTKIPALADYLQILQLNMTRQRKLALIGVLLLGTMYVCYGIDRHAPPKLTSYRSIVAAIIRIVFGFQIQANGLNTPTDVDGKCPVSPSLYRSLIILTKYPPSEAVKTLLYWGMLEAGISLIATNLPSIYFLIRKESLQSFANSIRSRISLSSMRSQRSNSDTGGLKEPEVAHTIGGRRQHGDMV